MRTLGEIINAARNGERPEYDELRYAVCALDGLSTFDRVAFGRLAEAEQENKRPMLTNSAVWQNEENFRRWKNALGMSPREYLGPRYDPDNPESVKRRKAAIAFTERFMRETNGN